MWALGDRSLPIKKRWLLLLQRSIAELDLRSGFMPRFIFKAVKLALNIPRIAAQYRSYGSQSFSKIFFKA